MEVLPSSKFSISPTLTKFSAKYSVAPNQSQKLGINFRCLPLIISSKKSSYQDFQEYAKPSRLLAAGGVRDASSIENFSSTKSKSKSLYRLRLQTSNAYGSGLNDVNSGVLLCLIDENGSSILQRLPAIPVGGGADDDTWRFQRGSIDEFAFEGPRLGRIVSVWISLESGEWRLSGMNLRVISREGEMNSETKRLMYGFELEDILLGEKGEASMMELKPHSITAFSDDESTLFDKEEDTASPESNEEGMREYTYLKLSLLFYDVVLILAGSAVASITMGENVGYAFFIGGLLGFAYLLLVQRSVDELPAPELIGSENGVSGFGTLKGSVSILVLVFALVVIMVKYVSGDYGARLGSMDIVFGMIGFLMCKVALVLAAFKPMTFSLRENE